MSNSKELSAKAKKFQKYIQASLDRYEAEKTPESERKISSVTQCIEDEARKFEEAILGAKVEDAKGCKDVGAKFLSLNKCEKRTNVRKVVREMLSDYDDAIITKVFGASRKQINNLIRGDWADKVREKLGIGKVGKTCFVFNLYRWTEENNNRRASITGTLTDDQIKGMLSGDDTVDTWKEKHACQVLVDIYSETLKYTKYNEATLAGIFYAEKVVTENAVLTELQNEFAYKAFLEGRKLNLPDLNKTKDNIISEKVDTETGEIKTANAC